MNTPTRRRSSLQWQLGFHAATADLPQEWMPATVPGAVQLDVAQHESYEPYWYADNWQDYRWMEDQYWTYRSAFTVPSLQPGERLYFVSLGIDYQFEIYLNQQLLHAQEGMFTPVHLDLTEHLKEQNELRVKLFPVPKAHEAPEDRTQARLSTKPAVSYVWDWHPRLVPLGIWDDTYLEVRPSAHLDSVQVGYQLDEACETANGLVEVTGQGLTAHKLRLSLRDPEGKDVLSTEVTADSHDVQLPFSLLHPQLWWPLGQGEQALYRWELQLLDGSGQLLDQAEGRVGFRRVRMVMNEGAWVEPIRFPKSRSVPPITLEINGRRIFGKGTNWVNPEIFPGTITRERYEGLLDLACEAHFNLLRIWGGGIVNKAPFFELCDEKGLMVWQEFPLSCNDYPDDPHYLKVLEQESTSIIQRLYNHPSLVMWCGGNELFNNWSGMTDQSLALRLLNSQCYRLDPQRPFIMTAPLMGMGHGNYVFRDFDTGEEVFQAMPKATNTAYTEFGMPGPSSVELLKSFIPEDQLFPPREGTVWETHHAFNAWQGKTWLMDDVLEDYFGEFKDLESLVAAGQWLQSEGYKCIFEEARRQWPYCSMALNWCYNEPWPTAANNSLINWPLEPKPAFEAVKNACRPVLASARIPKFSWKEGEVFSFDAWMLNDGEALTEAFTVELKLVGDEEISLLKWEVPALEARTNLAGPTLRQVLPRWEGHYLELQLIVHEHPGWSSTYALKYQQKEAVEQKKTAVLNQ